MENNIVNNGGGLKLENPVEVTLPYTATRDCFMSVGYDKLGGEKYIYFSSNGAEQKYYRFNLYGTGGSRSSTVWFPVKAGDTIDVARTDISDYRIYVM